jgi:hypothetical protein
MQIANVVIFGRELKKKIILWNKKEINYEIFTFYHKCTYH